MQQSFVRRPVLLLAWCAILLAGAVMGGLGVQQRREELLQELTQDARKAALAFDPAALGQLEGSRADLNRPVYTDIKQRLRALQAVDSHIRFVYVFRAKPDGTVSFLADSAPPGSSDESLPGDVYAEAAQSPGLQEILRTGQPATEGPLADRFGKWVTAYAAVGPEGRRDILGVDFDAANWYFQLAGAGLGRAAFVWLLFGFPLGAWYISRRQDEQLEVIRNLSEAMEQSHSALMIVDLDHRIEYANRGLCLQTGYSRRELSGKEWGEFRSPDTPEALGAELVAAVRAGQSWEGEWTNRRKDGTTYPVRGNISPVKRRDGALACFIAVLDDVTDVKRREAELREARDLAEAGDRAKGHFLATMSHEVRTPLNGIVGFTSLLLDTELAPDQREYVQTIRASGEALIQLTSDILDFARIDSGKLKLDPLACDPRECVEEALDLLGAKAGEKGIELLHRTDDGVPAAVVIDGGRLRQVLVNLIGNAVKFTDRGEVEVTLRAQPEPPPLAGGLPTCILEFSVRDTGIGLAPDQVGKLFKPFTQLDESYTRRHGGTGLGLAISRHLVRLLGGEIHATGEPGKGATFTFTVRAPVAAPARPPPDLPGLRLALIAPAGSLRQELARVLRRWRIEVHEGETAEAIAGEWDLALVDVPEPRARELARQAAPPARLPAARTFGLVPITLATELRHALRDHFSLLINKPVHQESLFALLSGASPAAVTGTRPPTHFGLRVLVVEDNPVNQRLMQRVLENLGCTWASAANGRKALDELSARAADYDVVLLDLHMPEMDGLTALDQIRHGHVGARAQTIWIIALTADAREEQRSRARAGGVNDYLTKPLKLPELEAALRRFRTERTTTRR